MEKEFIKFLKERRLFAKFKSHVREYFYSGPNTHSFKKLMAEQISTPSSFVSGGFTFSATPEGFDFW